MIDNQFLPPELRRHNALLAFNRAFAGMSMMDGVKFIADRIPLAMLEGIAEKALQEEFKRHNNIAEKTFKPIWFRNGMTSWACQISRKWWFEILKPRFWQTSGLIKFHKITRVLNGFTH